MLTLDRLIDLYLDSKDLTLEEKLHVATIIKAFHSFLPVVGCYVIQGPHRN